MFRFLSSQFLKKLNLILLKVIFYLIFLYVLLKIELMFFFRPSTRRQGASVSYKENSAEETGSEDLVEVEWGQEAVAAAVESENAETIERIIDTRMGRKGG